MNDVTAQPRPTAKSLFEAAIARHREGDIDKAEPLYRQVLALSPGSATACSNRASPTRST